MVKRAHGNDLVDVIVQLHHETEKAWLVSDGTSTPTWIAKSMAELETNPGGKTHTLTGPEWVLLEKGLI
jgi:hypothetical protein